MYLTCFKDSLPILSDSYQVIFASKLSYGCWHKGLPYTKIRFLSVGADALGRPKANREQRTKKNAPMGRSFFV